MWNSLKHGWRRYTRSPRENAGGCTLPSIVRDLGGCPPTCKACFRTRTCANKRDGGGGQAKSSCSGRVRGHAIGLRGSHHRQACAFVELILRGGPSFRGCE